MKKIFLTSVIGLMTMIGTAKADNLLSVQAITNVIMKQNSVSALLSDPSDYTSAVATLTACIKDKGVKYLTLNNFAECCVEMPFASVDNMNTFINLVVRTHNDLVAKGSAQPTFAEFLKEVMLHGYSYAEIFDESVKYVAKYYSEPDLRIVFSVNDTKTPLCVLSDKWQICKPINKNQWFIISFNEPTGKHYLKVISSGQDIQDDENIFVFNPNDKVPDDNNWKIPYPNAAEVTPCYAPENNIDYTFTPSNHYLVTKYENFLKDWPNKTTTKSECEELTTEFTELKKQLIAYNGCAAELNAVRNSYFQGTKLYSPDGSGFKEEVVKYLTDCMSNAGAPVYQFQTDRYFDKVSCRLITKIGQGGSVACSGIISTGDIIFNIDDLNDLKKSKVLCEKPKETITPTYYNTGVGELLKSHYETITKDPKWGTQVTYDECGRMKTELQYRLLDLQNLDRCYKKMSNSDYAKTTYADTQTKDLNGVADILATDLARCINYSIGRDVIRKDIECTGKCNTVGDDYPVCTGIGNGKVTFTFGDICNWKFL